MSETKRFRVVSNASVLGYFQSVNAAAGYCSTVTIDGERGRCHVESWGVAPYWDGDWTVMQPQP